MNYLAQMLGQFGRIEYAARLTMPAVPGAALDAEAVLWILQDWIESIPFTETRGS